MMVITIKINIYFYKCVRKNKMLCRYQLLFYFMFLKIKSYVGGNFYFLFYKNKFKN